MIEFKKEEFYTTCTGFDAFTGCTGLDSLTGERQDYGTIRGCGDCYLFFPAPGIAYTVDDLNILGQKVYKLSGGGFLGEKIPPKSKK